MATKEVVPMRDMSHTYPVSIKMIAIPVQNLEEATRFYQLLTGFSILVQNQEHVSLSANGTEEMLRLVKSPSMGNNIDHFAFLLPSRKHLGCFLRHLIEMQIPILGAIDHAFSESIYLEDQDGNRIEIASDKDGNKWFDDFHELRNNDSPFDYSGVFYECETNESPFHFPENTVLGHVMINVRNKELQRRFYEQMLGFDIMRSEEGEPLLLGKGGYHHHIGLLEVESGSSMDPIKMLSIAYCDCEALANTVNRLATQGIKAQETQFGYCLDDYEGNRICLVLDN